MGQTIRTSECTASVRIRTTVGVRKLQSSLTGTYDLLHVPRLSLDATWVHVTESTVPPTPITDLLSAVCACAVEGLQSRE